MQPDSVPCLFIISIDLVKFKEAKVKFYLKNSFDISFLHAIVEKSWNFHLTIALAHFYRDVINKLSL